MNRILIEDSEVSPDGLATLSDGRADHIRSVLRSRVGDTLKAGVVNGRIGTGRVLELNPSSVTIKLLLETDSEPPWVDLILAIPRPKVLKRLWAQLAAIGVRRVALVNAARVEKAYFSTGWTREEKYRPLLIEGLSQSGATRLPEVTVHRLFRPFIEDEMDRLFPQSWRLVGHPGPPTALAVPDIARRCRTSDEGLPLLAIGPEGGWTPFELEMLGAHGFRRFAAGERILRSDTACIALLAVLWYGIATGRRRAGDAAAAGSS